MFSNPGSTTLTFVALRKESVDRNNDTTHKKKNQPGSLSARRAWIEIAWHCMSEDVSYVALRKESVDRNVFKSRLYYFDLSSLSARRAWIEI